MSVRIVLADDHTILRQGVRAFLIEQPDFLVVGEAANGATALQLVEQLRPDVLVVDVMMPQINGLEVCRQVSERFPATRVIILTMHAKEAYVSEAIRNGAKGYVLKESESSDLIQSIRDVVDGKLYLSPPLTERAIELYFQKARQQPGDIFDTLTAREREVFQLVVEGLGSAEIAQRMTVSIRTVDVYRASIMKKLEIKNQADWFRLAVKRGLLSEE